MAEVECVGLVGIDCQQDAVGRLGARPPHRLDFFQHIEARCDVLEVVLAAPIGDGRGDVARLLIGQVELNVGNAGIVGRLTGAEPIVEDCAPQRSGVGDGRCGGHGRYGGRGRRRDAIGRVIAYLQLRAIVFNRIFAGGDEPLDIFVEEGAQHDAEVGVWLRHPSLHQRCEVNACPG